MPRTKEAFDAIREGTRQKIENAALSLFARKGLSVTAFGYVLGCYPKTVLPKMNRLGKLSVAEYTNNFKNPAIKLLLNSIVQEFNNIEEVDINGIRCPS